MKRILSLALSVLLLLIPAGCSSNVTAPSSSTANVKDMVTLNYYTIGNPDPDLREVNDALNVLLAEKIGVQVNYQKVSWSEYGDFVTRLINSGSEFDIMFASSPSQGDFLGNARAGVWLELEGYLNGSCKEMYDVIDPLYWEGVRVNGHIYGVPTNKELAVPISWVYSEELVNKYDIDISQYTTLESLEPVFKLIKENEPEYTVMDISSEASNYFALEGYEYLIDSKVPLMLRSDDKDLKLVNIFSTSTARHILHTLREYYTAGYINNDAALTHDQSLAAGKKVFWFAASGGPYSETIWSKERGYPLLGQQVTKSFVNTESVRGAIMAVSSNTKYPQECASFLNCLNTDPEVRNLINYGIEGKHYTLTENDQVQVLDSDYSGIQYTQGNWFILKTVVGDPLNKWDVYREFNENAVRSYTLGFVPSVSDSTVSKYISDVSAVTDKYYSVLMTGTVDPDIVLPLFLKELEDAGIRKLQTALQEQLDSWKTVKRT